jgi:hypothetical protein
MVHRAEACASSDATGDPKSAASPRDCQGMTRVSEGVWPSGRSSGELERPGETALGSLAPQGGDPAGKHPGTGYPFPRLRRSCIPVCRAGTGRRPLVGMPRPRPLFFLDFGHPIPIIRSMIGTPKSQSVWGTGPPEVPREPEPPRCARSFRMNLKSPKTHLFGRLGEPAA